MSQAVVASGGGGRLLVAAMLVLLAGGCRASSAPDEAAEAATAAPTGMFKPPLQRGASVIALGEDGWHYGWARLTMQSSGCPAWYNKGYGTPHVFPARLRHDEGAVHLETAEGLKLKGSADEAAIHLAGQMSFASPHSGASVDCQVGVTLDLADVQNDGEGTSGTLDEAMTTADGDSDDLNCEARFAFSFVREGRVALIEVW